MARDTSAAAGQNSQTGQQLSSGYTSQANNNSSVLTPTLNAMATNPQGFGQSTVNSMNTAALQSAGGAAAGTAGAANMAAARTNNAGAYAPAATQAGHDATSALSDAALGVQNKDAMLKEQQRQEGLSGLEGLYNTNVSAGENGLGLSNQSLGVQNQSNQNGWLQNTMGVLGGLGNLGRGAGALGVKI